MALIVLFLAGCSNAQRTSLPPLTRVAPLLPPKFQAPDPAGPLRSFEQIVALPDEQFDVAEAVLALAAESKEQDSAAVNRDTLSEIDRLAANAKTDLPENPDGNDYFDTFYEVVLDRRAADPFREDRAENYDLSLAVSKRRGSCLSIGIMTLAVARRMGAPVWGVQCPAHFFLKYIPPPGSKRGKTLNFDVTRPMSDNYEKLDDEFYRHWHHIDPQAEANGAYLRPLSDREVVSAFLASRSSYYALKGSLAQALKDAERAVKLNPRNVTAHTNAGFASEALGKFVQAAEYYSRALEVDAHSVNALNDLAYLKVRDPQSPVFDPRGAQKLIEHALRLQPGRAFLLATSAEVKAATQDWRGAGRTMQEAMKLDPKNQKYRDRFMQFREKVRAQ
ncbi:MAG TPA: transglutaminase family protein [Planctomycetota bacterium]